MEHDESSQAWYRICLDFPSSAGTSFFSALCRPPGGGVTNLAGYTMANTGSFMEKNDDYEQPNELL